MRLRERSTLELAKALYRLDNANPDVGMGMPARHFIDEAVKRLDLNPAKVLFDVIEPMMITHMNGRN